MSPLEITAETREEALEEALDILDLPEEALELEWSEEDEDLLAGARPHVKLVAHVRPMYVAEQIRECTEVLLGKMEIEAEVEIDEDQPEAMLVRIDSDRDGALIGHRGETLDAIQHLVVRMTRMSGREMPLVLLDVGDYRKRRIERLRRVAEELAEDAIEFDREEPLDPMNAIDRKIMHTILKDIDGVRSFSRGDEPDRCVVIEPE